jgi:hypothetical protein
MSEAQEKDNFWVYIGGLIAVTVILVFMLKGRETEHLESINKNNSVKQEVGKIENKYHNLQNM